MSNNGGRTIKGLIEKYKLLTPRQQITMRQERGVWGDVLFLLDRYDERRVMEWLNPDEPPPPHDNGAPVSDTVLCYCGRDERNEPIYRWGYFDHTDQAWSINKHVTMQVLGWLYIPLPPDSKLSEEL